MPGFPPPINPSYEPTTSITRIAATAAIEEMVAVIEQDGALILTGLVSSQDVAAVSSEMEPHVREARVKPRQAYDLIPKETVMVPGVVGKSPSMAKIAEYDVIHGASRQRLHRDDMIFGIHHHAAEYSLSNETMPGFMIAGSQTTRANGATMAIPGSHKWDHSRVLRPDEVCFAELEPGSAFVFLGTVYHGAGQNSVVDQVRRVYGLFFVPGTHRTEENQLLAIPRSRVLGMSDKMLSLLGYKTPGTYLGIVNNGDPADNLKATLKLANA